MLREQRNRLALTDYDQSMHVSEGRFLLQIKSLTITHRKALRTIIQQFPGAIISISHDRKYITEVCDTVYRMTAEGLMPTTKDQL